MGVYKLQRYIHVYIHVVSVWIWISILLVFALTLTSLQDDIFGLFDLVMTTDVAMFNGEQYLHRDLTPVWHSNSVVVS